MFPALYRRLESFRNFYRSTLVADSAAIVLTKSSKRSAKIYRIIFFLNYRTCVQIVTNYREFRVNDLAAASDDKSDRRKMGKWRATMQQQ